MLGTQPQKKIVWSWNCFRKWSVLKEILRISDFQKKLTFGVVTGAVFSRKMGNKNKPLNLFPQDITDSAVSKRCAVDKIKVNEAVPPTTALSPT